MELLFCSCVSFSHTFLQCYSHTTIPFRKENQYQDTTQDYELRYQLRKKKQRLKCCSCSINDDPFRRPLVLPHHPSYKCNRKIQFSHCAILTITHYTIAVLCCMLYNISYYYQSSIRERYYCPSMASETNEKRKANVNHNILNIVYKILLLLSSINSY